MAHNFQPADAKHFLRPTKCAHCGKSINIFSKVVSCSHTGCHVNLHRDCFKKTPLLPDCIHRPLDTHKPTSSPTPSPASTPPRQHPPSSTPSSSSVPPPSSTPTLPPPSSSSAPPPSSSSPPPSATPALHSSYQQQAPAPAPAPQYGYQQQQAPAPSMYQGQPPAPQGYGAPVPYGYQQPYQPAPYQQAPPPGAYGAPVPQMTNMMASMNVNASAAPPAQPVPQYQGAVFNQVLYNGAPLQVNPWHAQQQQPAWAMPPQQYMPPPQQYQQQYPTLGKTEPITTYYDIGDVLGKGAFSEVRDCRCKRTGIVYAVKIMKKDYNDKRTMDITYMELRVFKRIDQGPHCVHLIDLFESPHHYFLVMEKITGGELFQQITKLKKYSERRASQLVEQMLKGIHHLWSVNIVHRDLKPENLLLTSKEEDADLLITDFGLSFIVQRADEIMTHPVGTPGYVAPELVMCMDNQGRTGYSKSVDMWAAGVIIYIMLCGFPPFMGQDTNETFAKIKSLQFSFPSPWWDNVSNSAKDLICHCLDPDPNRRYTPIDALKHPWITENKQLNEEQLSVEELKRFNAKRKLKGAMVAVRMAVKAQLVLNSSKDLGTEK